MKSEMARARMRIFIGVTAQWERYKASILAQIACNLAYVHTAPRQCHSPKVGCMHLMKKKKE